MQELKQKIDNLVAPLKKINSVRSIFIYGSSVRKGIQKGHDIDILVIYDDSLENPELEKINFFQELITTKAKKEELILHFQPPKPISLWWKLIKEGEPWAISALKDSIILYDNTEFIKTIKKLLRKSKLYSIDLKVEKLITRAVERFISVRNELAKAAWLLLNTMTTASQIMLSFLSIYTVSANETRDMLIKNKNELGISDIFIEWYDELIKINEKIAKGTMSEFKASEIDLWSKRVSYYIRVSEDIIIKLEKKIREKEIKESYDYIIKLCDSALSLKIKEIPKDEKEKIELFKKYFVDTNLIERQHYEIIKKMYKLVKEKKEIEEEIDKIYIKMLEAAINEILQKK
ncbi:MAG: nucleotidyltransferase domain-containing protein [Candidatus Pacearchaeota archaeon]